jgi:hypothetical protein
MKLNSYNYKKLEFFLLTTLFFFPLLGSENFIKENPTQIALYDEKTIPEIATINSTFQPVIDGIFSNEEHWELAENIHCSYLHTDYEHDDNYNYIYTGRVNGKLYVLVDLCSDITDDSENGEWISLWIDTDNSKSNYNYSIYGNAIDEDILMQELYINMGWLYDNFTNNMETQNGTEGIFYNTSSDATYITFHVSEVDMVLNSTVNVTVAYGFNSSINSRTQHRIYEFEINIADLNNMTETSDYGILVQGYGTLSSAVFEAGYYSLGLGSDHAYSAYIINYLYYLEWAGYPAEESIFNEFTKYYSIILGASQERYYFPCGISPNIKDLKDNPSLFTKPTTSLLSPQPIIDGLFNSSEGWELAENVHMEFLHVDDKHQDNYNYIYSTRDEEHLYILLDLCSDITDDYNDGEWISLWLDTDFNQYYYQYQLSGFGINPNGTIQELQQNLENQISGLNNSLINKRNGVEVIIFNATANYSYINLETLDGIIQLNSTANFTVKCSFNSSPNSDQNHRIYEFEILLGDLTGMTPISDFGLFIEGYGTMNYPLMTHNYDESGFYTLGQGTDSIYLAQILNWLYYQGYVLDETDDTLPNDITTSYSILYFPSFERFYFPMGLTAMDLQNNPSIYPKPNYIDWERILTYEPYGYPTPLLWTDGSNIITAFLNNENDIEINAWNQNGLLIWEDTWISISKQHRIMDIWGDSDFYYIAMTEEISNGYSQMVIIKWAKNGTFITSGIFHQTTGWDKAIAILGNDTHLFTFGYSHQNTSYDAKSYPQLVCWDKQNLLPVWNMSIYDVEGIGHALMIDGNEILLYGYQYGVEVNQHFAAKYNLITQTRQWLTSWEADTDSYENTRTIHKIDNQIYIFDQTYIIPGIDYYILNWTDGNLILNVKLDLLNDAYMNQFFYYEGFFFLDIGLEIQTSLSGGVVERSLGDGTTIHHAILKVGLDGEIEDIWEFRPKEYYVEYQPFGISLCNQSIYSITTEIIPEIEWEEYECTLLKWNIKLIDDIPLTPIMITESKTIQNNSEIISWNPSNGATYYNIYVNNSLNGTTQSPYFPINFKGNGSYLIEVSAGNETGESNRSVPITIKVEIPPTLILPIAPSIITQNQTLTGTTLNLSWSPVEGGKNYRIYINDSLQQTVGNKSLILIFSSNGTYIITITAVNDDGESNKSNAIAITVAIPPPLNPPAAPTIITQNQTISGNQLNFSWNAVERATSYQIYINGILNQTVSNTSIIIVFPGNGTYILTLVAQNADGESASSQAIEIIIAIPPEVKPEVLTGEVIIGLTFAGTSIGLVGASILSPDKIKELIEVRKYVTQQDTGKAADFLSPSDATPKDLVPKGDLPVSGGEAAAMEITTTTGSAGLASVTPATSFTTADFVEMIKKLKLLWDKIPFEYRELINRTIDKYYKFKDQATIMVFGSFKGLSNNFFNACDLIRKGDFQDALLKLDDVSKQAAEKKFIDLAEEAQNLAIEKCKGGKCE